MPCLKGDIKGAIRCHGIFSVASFMASFMSSFMSSFMWCREVVFPLTYLWHLLSAGGAKHRGQCHPRATQMVPGWNNWRTWTSGVTFLQNPGDGGRGYLHSICFSHFIPVWLFPCSLTADPWTSRNAWSYQGLLLFPEWIHRPTIPVLHLATGRRSGITNSDLRWHTCSCRPRYFVCFIRFIHFMHFIRVEQE